MLGNGHPVRVQSMTNTPTADTRKTIAQCIRIIEAGGELVRITCRNTAEAENLKNIREALRTRGFDTPLAADVHFNPRIALIAASVVEKVRINPGNYTDIPAGRQNSVSAVDYQNGLSRMEETFGELIGICKEHGTAIRIGVNHGSLSGRLLSRCGDTPEGMVESAMEFLRVCRSRDFHRVLVSLKSSNTRVMVQANRLLAARLEEEGFHTPVHLGVTEAGGHDEGRIKSAIGMGTLLAEGIGDTLRMSLSEDPEHEIPPSRILARMALREGESVHRAGPEPKGKKSPVPGEHPEAFPRTGPASYIRRDTLRIRNIGGGQVPVVIGDLPADPSKEGYPCQRPDYVFETAGGWKPEGKPMRDTVLRYADWKHVEGREPGFSPLIEAESMDADIRLHPVMNFLGVNCASLDEKLIGRIRANPSLVIVLRPPGKGAGGKSGSMSSSKAGEDSRTVAGEVSAAGAGAEFRQAIATLDRCGCRAPVILNPSYRENDPERFMILSAAETGPLFVDGLADGIWITRGENPPASLAADTAFHILQGSRARMTRTEYIVCPSCGRTTFNIQETAARVKAATLHLKHLKIAVMGCIVNGPGEMADADYGYVGSRPGKITLYKGKTPVKRNIPEENAVEELTALIRESGDWKDR